MSLLTSRTFALAALFVAVTHSAAVAAEPGDGACELTFPAGFTPAVPVEQRPPEYPREALNAWSEGFALLELTITPQGDVRDAFVVDAMGAKEFVSASVKAVLKHRYQPATRGGVPVAQMLRPYSISYMFRDTKSEADHAEFIDLFKRARRQLQDNRPDDTIATLERMFRWRVNFYEQAMGSYLLALAYAQKQDWESARYHAEHATFEEQFLDPATLAAAKDLVVKLRARTGDLAGALCALRHLTPAARQPLAALEAEARTRLASDAPLISDAKLIRVPLTDQPGTWRRKLARRKFSFANVTGQAASFRLACVATSLDAPVDMETEWTVPEQAGSCIIRVTGTPGTTFKFVEDR